MEEENTVETSTEGMPIVSSIAELQVHIYQAELAILNILVRFMQNTGVLVEDIKLTLNQNQETQLSLLVGGKSISFASPEEETTETTDSE